MLRRICVVSLTLLLAVALVKAQSDPSDDDDSSSVGRPDTYTLNPELEIFEEHLDMADEEDADFDFQIRCAEYDFPEYAFAAQQDSTKAYFVVDEILKSPFTDVDLTKFVTVFGVRLVAHKSVDDDKILHVANLVAQFLDNDADGVIDHPAMGEQLVERFATMFLVSDQAFTDFLLSANEDEGLPLELKYCPFSFDYEEITKIQPGGDVEINCPEDLFNKDRSVAFASDHLIGRGWPKLLVTTEEEMDTSPVFLKFDQFYKKAVADGVFHLDQTGCPEDDQDYCGMVMFASWTLTTYLGVDRCWCQSVGAWTLCDKKDAEEKYPELMEFIETNMVPNIPDGAYSPSDNSVIIRVSQLDRSIIDAAEVVAEAAVVTDSGRSGSKPTATEDDVKMTADDENGEAGEDSSSSSSSSADQDEL